MCCNISLNRIKLSIPVLIKIIPFLHVNRKILETTKSDTTMVQQNSQWVKRHYSKYIKYV